MLYLQLNPIIFIWQGSYYLISEDRNIIIYVKNIVDPDYLKHYLINS